MSALEAISQDREHYQDHMIYETKSLDFGERMKDPHDVFTPRAAVINNDMYVSRRTLEKKLSDAMLGGKHIVIHGESGSGKSWLYKKVLNDRHATYKVVNLASAATSKSIQEELAAVIDRIDPVRKTGYTENKKAAIGIPGLGGEIAHTGNYEIKEPRAIERLFQRLSESASGQPSWIIFDNLESIFGSKELMEEMANLIILLDDESFAKYKVKFVIVGVPSGVKEYFTKTSNHGTVANRLQEIPEVSRLTETEADQLIQKGFCASLGYRFLPGETDEIRGHICWVTDRVPQRLHEYCLELALIGRSQREIAKSMLDGADEAWLQTSLSADYAAIERHLNTNSTTVGRRNQLIYVLGQMERDEFKVSDLESKLRAIFPHTTHAVANLNLNPHIGAIANGDDAIIKKTPRGNAYMFRDPKYRMCIRSMLRKDKEKVSNIDLSRISNS